MNVSAAKETPKRRPATAPASWEDLPPSQSKALGDPGDLCEGFRVCGLRVSGFRFVRGCGFGAQGFEVENLRLRA